jgi:hypothetical protein
VTVATASEAKLERVKESSQTKGAACGKPFDREVWPAAKDVETTESEVDMSESVEPSSLMLRGHVRRHHGI